MRGPAVKRLARCRQPHRRRLAGSNIRPLRWAKFRPGGKVDFNPNCAKRLAGSVRDGTYKCVGCAFERQYQPRASAYDIPSLVYAKVDTRFFSLFPTFAMTLAVLTTALSRLAVFAMLAAFTALTAGLRHRVLATSLYGSMFAGFVNMFSRVPRTSRYP